MSEGIDAAVRLKLEDLMSSGLQRVKGELKGVGDATHQAGQQAEHSGGLFSGFAGGLAKIGLAAGGISVITQAFKGLTMGLISGNAEFERYEVQFGVLLGSVDKAKERIGALSKFAATTPFELPEVVKAGKVLETFGLQGEKGFKRFGLTTEQMLATVGDAAAGSGARFDELALTFGKFASGATGEALMRMQELGLTTREELASMGVAFDKSGSLLTDKDKALGIVIGAVNKRFGGMMEKQSQTFEGMTSNLGDWIGQTQRKLAAPIFEIVKDKLAGLLTFLQDPATIAALEGFATAIAEGVGKAIETIGTVVGVFGDLFGIISGKAPAAGENLRAAFGGEAATMIATIAATIRDILVGAFQRMSEWWAENGPTIKAAVGILVDAFKDFARDVGQAIGFVKENWDKIEPVVKVAVALMIPHFVALAAAAVLNAATVVGSWIATHVAAAAAAVIHSAQVALQIAGWALLGVQALLHAAKVAAAWLIAIGPLGLVIAAVVGIVALIVLNWDKIVSATQGLRDGIGGALKAIGGFLTGLGETIGGFAASVWTKLTEIGSAIANGIKAGITAAWDGLMEKLRGLVNLIPEGIRNLLGITSPSKVTAGIGYEIVAGLAQGIAAGFPEVEDLTTGLIGHLMSKAQAAAIQMRSALQEAGVSVGTASASLLSSNIPSNAVLGNMGGTSVSLSNWATGRLHGDEQTINLVVDGKLMAQVVGGHQINGAIAKGAAI